MLRSAWLALNLLIATIVIGPLTIGGALVRARGDFFHWCARTWSGWLLRANGTRVDVIGIENVAPDRPQVIAANHVSWFDVLAIATTLPKRFRFVAKEELGRVPIFGAAWKAAGHIAVDRRDTQAAITALREAGRLMHADNSALVIFPEGTRSPDGELLPFKKGAFMLALAAGTEIVPAAVSGTRRMLPKGSWRVRGGRITLRFGPPIQPRDYGEGSRDALIEAVR
ncbi:MAG TPA: lysophospholipid acyltransferase family protein, partial [Longimicrobiales bacterium]|nr:lysophospholipid acyltransferase family protein [Longimicrobiales bacterium]